MRHVSCLGLAVAVAACAGGSQPTPAPATPRAAQAGGPSPAGIGVRALRGVTDALRRKLALAEFEGGVVVELVHEGSPAAAAGLRPDDVIRALDGKVLRDNHALFVESSVRPVGRKVELQVARGPKTFAVTVALYDAVASLEAACGRGLAPACGDLARRYDFGLGVARDAAKALALNTKACDGGDVLGCHALGATYANGEGVPKDYARAAMLLRVACDGGSPGGCAGLGVLFEKGAGVAKDEARAAALYRGACDGGNGAGCYGLGRMYDEGLGLQQDRAKAAELFRQACNAGASEGCPDPAPASPRPRSPAMAFDGIYGGQLAGRRVTVLIADVDESGGSFSGQYAYLDVGLPIGLAGKVQAGVAQAEETDGPDNVTGRWSGRFSRGGFSGDWTSPDGARHARIALSRELQGDGRGRALEPGRAPRRLEDVFSRGLARLNLRPGAEVAAGEVAYRTMLQTVTGIGYPRLTRHPDPAALARINADLEERQLESVSGALQCSPALGRNYEHHEDVEVGLFSRKFLSLSIAGLSLCGGPGFSDWRDAVTYDLESGQPLDLQREFLVTGKTGTLDERFVPVFVRYAREQDPKIWTDARELEGCLSGTAYRTVLSLHPKGLVVRTDFVQHVDAGCEASAVVPYAALERFRRPGSTLSFGPSTAPAGP